MVSQRRNGVRRDIVNIDRGRNFVNGYRNKRKLRKKVTWDKSIALREEEIQEHEDEIDLQETQEPFLKALPLVTFVEKFKPTKRDPMEKVVTPNGWGGIKFHLENGRVYVPDVLASLGVSQLQYEEEPGVWHVLQELKSGRSANKFMNGQVIPFRIVNPKIQSSSEILDIKESESPIKCKTYSSKQITTFPDGSLRNPMIQGGGVNSGHAQRLSPWKDRWIVEGDTIEDYYGRVSRLIEDRTHQGGGLCGIGVVLRLAFHQKHTRLLLTCRHIVAREDEANLSTRGQLYAFGGPVKVLHMSKKYDLALLQGPPLLGPNGFNLAHEGEEQPGREVRLLTFPWYLDNVWGQVPLTEVQPSEMQGHVASIGVRRQSTSEPLIVDALATYMGGLPGCSGGAVTLNSKILCGVHTGVYPSRLKDHGIPQDIYVAANKAPIESNNINHTNITKPMEGSRTFVLPQVQRPSTKRKVALLGGSPMFTRCSSTHGFLDVYVSSSHIRETCLEWYAKPRIKKILDNILPF